MSVQLAIYSQLFALIVFIADICSKCFVANTRELEEKVDVDHFCFSSSDLMYPLAERTIHKAFNFVRGQMQQMVKLFPVFPPTFSSCIRI